MSCCADQNLFLCIDGIPTPLKRHRSCILNNRVHSYDSQKEAKKTALKCVQRQIPDGFQIFDEPLEMLIEFHMPIPQSLSQKKKLQLQEVPHDKKPDLSNLIKFVEDTFNGIIYKDDSQIVNIHASKLYSSEPKTIVCFRPYVVEKKVI